MCLMHGIGAVHVVTDCKALVDGLDAGPDVTSRATRAYAEIWIKIWAKLADVGRDLVTVEWVPSHTSWKEASARGIPWLHHKANRLADDFAKRGAKIHPASELVESQRPLLWWSAYFVSLYTGRILGNLAAHGFPDVLTPRVSRSFDPLELVSDPKRHQVKHHGERWSCLNCGLSV